MKRSDKLLALTAVLGALCVGIVLLSRMEENKEQIRQTGDVILDVPVEEVTSVQWRNGDTELSFHKEGERWVYDGDERFPVNTSSIEGMLALFEGFGASFCIEEVTDLGLYGLDDPKCVITFATEKQTYTMELGDDSKMDEERYLSIGDGKVYLAKVDPLETFDAVLDDLIQHDESLSYDQVNQITFQGAVNSTVFREEDSPYAFCDADEYFVEQDGETLPLDSDRVSTYLEALTTLRLTNYVTYDVSDEELEQYDLLEPELTITVNHTMEDGEAAVYSLSVSRDAEALAAAEEAEANGEEPEEVPAYVRVGESQLVYRVSEYTSQALFAASYNDLRHRQVLVADFDDVTQIDISLEGEEYTFQTDGVDDEQAHIWKQNGTEIDLGGLQKELEALKVSSSSDFCSEQPTGKQEIALTVHLDSETRPTVTIELYRRDSVDCLAVVDGMPLALVSRSDVVDLVEAVYAIVLDDQTA